MPSLCFYFQVHQPTRIKRYSYFDNSANANYFDDSSNREIVRKVAEKCYLPTNQIMLKLIQQYEGAFRVAYSISGVAVEQLRAHAPEAFESFVDLARTGCVEFLAETYYHSLSSLFDHVEFKEQVEMHRSLMQELFGQKPRVFRNTELIYADFIGNLVTEMGFKAILAEGADDILGWRSPNFLYTVPDTETCLLLKNHRLSDDIAFRFSQRDWAGWPLSAEKFASWVHRISGSGDIVNIFLDYETFGEHQNAASGIFDFLEQLPQALLSHPHWSILTPSQVIDKYPAVADLAFHRLASWADNERDLSAWRGNRMQDSALRQVYELGQDLKATEAWHNVQAVDAWRKLLSSDHFYYMCTKWFEDGDVHTYFSPFESPYEAFVNYMNVLRDFRQRWLSEEEVYAVDESSPAVRAAQEVSAPH